MTETEERTLSDNTIVQLDQHSHDADGWKYREYDWADVVFGKESQNT